MDAYFKDTFLFTVRRTVGTIKMAQESAHSATSVSTSMLVPMDEMWMLDHHAGVFDDKMQTELLPTQMYDFVLVMFISKLKYFNKTLNIYSCRILFSF